MQVNRALSGLSVVSLLLAACIPLSAVAAPQWKWRDAEGRLQYSDRPPPAGVPDKDILARPRASAAPRPAEPAASVPASAPSKVAAKASDPELEARRRKAEAEQEAARKAEEDKIAKSRAENCERARSYERTLNDGMRIARVNSKGEREVLDDQARELEKRRSREAIDANCK